MIYRRFTFALLLLGAAACAESTPKDSVPTRGVTLDAKGEKLLLSWQAQNLVETYHVFYVNGLKASEIDSLPKTDPDFSNPRISIDSTNMNSWPAKGSKACFYVVAENAALLSDPSDQACVTMR
jgi:hypothetical protein